MIKAFNAWPEWARYGFVFAFALLFWSPSLFNEYAWDDTNNLVDSDRLRGWAAFFECFRHDAMWSARMNAAAISTYRPISLASFVVDYQLFGATAVSYHFTSVVWNALACMVVFAVLRRFMGLVESLVATCLFCVVPVNAEAVAWVNGRSEIFALLFGGLGVYVATSPRLPWFVRLFGTTPLLLLGMLGKETGVIFCAVAVLLGTEARHRRLEAPRLWLRSLDLTALLSGVLALAGYLWIRHLVFGGHPLPGATEKLSSTADLLGILAQSASIVWKCLVTVAIPDRISVGYLYNWAQTLTRTDLIIAWSALAAACVGLTFAWLRGHRLVVLMLAWWAFSIAPVLILVGRDWPGLARWLYMGGPGLVAAGVLLVQLVPGRMVTTVVGAAYGLVWSIQAQRSIEVWHDSGTLFERMIIEEPGERFGYLSLSWYYLRIADYPKSEKMARKVLEIGPRGHDPLPFLAASLAAQDKCDEARKTVFEPTPMPTRAAWMMFSVGACYERAGRPADALPIYKDCIASDKACETKAATLTATLSSPAPESAAPSAPATAAPL